MAGQKAVLLRAIAVALKAEQTAGLKYIKWLEAMEGVAPADMPNAYFQSFIKAQTAYQNAIIDTDAAIQAFDQWAAPNNHKTAQQRGIMPLRFLYVA